MQLATVVFTALTMALAAVFVPHHSSAQSAATGLPVPVAQALAQAGIPDSGAAVYVHEIGADRPLVAHGADRALNPASTMKLVTTYAALDLLGPAFMWNTEIFTTGTLAQEVLNGDLIIKGYGDPKLTLENFWLLLRNLRARGVREIRGELVLDRAYFAAEEFDAARFDDQPTRPYNTGPNALLVNYKAIRVEFLPDAETRSVKVAVEPQLPQVQIVNNLTLDTAACGDWISRLKLDSQGNSNSARLTFSGSFAQSCGERVRHYSVLGHQQYTLGLFTQLWRELGGSFSGGVREGEAPPGARLLTSAQSPALSEIVRDINKFSNNVMARQLFLTLGATGAGAPATQGKSNSVIKQWVNVKGLNIPELVLENGSGLSRLERISARNLGLLLINAFRSPVMPELMASLPLAAVDGTMRKRLAKADVAGQAHIKTGSLSGVRAIAGYVLDAQGRRVAVVFITNHANAHNAQPVQDALLKWVYSRQGESCCGPRRK